MSKSDASVQIEYLKKHLPEYFGEISAEVFTEISRHIQWLRVERDQILFNEGDPGDSMYILFSGRLQVYSGKGKQHKLHGYILQGESVGEMALIANEPRSATVRAMRSSLLIKIQADDFKGLVHKYPELLYNITRDIIGRLRKSNLALSQNFTPNNILFIQGSPDIDIDAFLQNFTGKLRPYAATRLVTPRSLKKPVSEFNDEELRNLLNTMNKLERKYQHVLVSCPYGDTGWLKMAGQIADRVYLLVDFDSAETVTRFEHEVLAYINQEYTKIEIVFCHRTGKKPEKTSFYKKLRGNADHYHIRLQEDKDFARLARIVSGNAIALVLGGGGARGLSHLGAVKALEEHNIPVDLVCGTSAGSTIASGVALDMDADTRYRLSSYFIKRKPFIDITLPVFSVLAGRRVNTALKEIFHETQMDDTWINFFTVASNISKISPEAIMSGPIWKAIRASLSLPALLPPVISNKEILVDGGIFNNVPIDMMKNFFKCRVIAINVSASPEYSIIHDEFPGPLKYKFRRLIGKETGSYPGFFDIISKLTTIASSSKFEKDYHLAEIVLHPPVEKYDMMETDKLDEIMKVGYEYTISRIEEIKKAVLY
ncbi:MAG: putative NTE family protein [Ignavibacteriaceae bacterium]|nr:putative NTE family protein [Ignavibacteriaceae bacterium]